MKTNKIYDENGNGFTRVFSTNKVEKINTIEYYRSYKTEKRALLLRDLLNNKNPYLTLFLNNEFFMHKTKTAKDYFSPTL